MSKRRSLKRLSASVLAVPVLAAAIAPAARAATLYWDADGSAAGDNTGTGAGLGGSATWSATNTNWFDGTVITTWSAGSDAIFTGTSGTTTLATTQTQSANSLTFKSNQTVSSAATSTLSLTGSAGLIADPSKTGTISGLLTGTVGYNISGGGTIILTNTANSITGPVSVTGGSTLSMTASSPIGGTGAGSGNVTLDNGIFINTNLNSAGGTFLSFNRGIVIGAGNGELSTPSAGTILIYTGTISGAVSGVGTVTKSGAGELRVGVGSFGKLIVNAGLWRLNSSASGETGFGAAPASVTADAVTLNGAAIGTSVSVSTVANRGMTIGAGGGAIILNASMTWGGNITGPGDFNCNNAFGFVGTASSTLRLNGTGTWGGKTIVNSGTLIANNGAAIPDASLVSLPTATTSTAIFNALASETIGNLTGGGPSGFSGAVTIGGTSSVILTVGADGLSSTYGGNVSGSGGLTKTGAGILTIKDWDWANTGVDSVTGGTIKFGNSAAGFSSSSTVSIGPSGTLDMNSINDTFGALSGSGAIINGGNITLAGTQNTSWSGSYTGGGTLTKTGTGIQTLNNSSAGWTALNHNGGRINYNTNNCAGSGPINVGTGATEFVSTAVGVNLANSVVLASGANPKIYATSPNSLEVSGPISGGGGLLRDDTGAGTLTLSGNNTYTGGFKITSRGVIAGHKNAFGTGPLTIGDAVTAPANPIVLQTSTPLTGANAIPNAITVNRDFTMDGSNDMELSGPVDMGAITKIINVTNTVGTSYLTGPISATDVNTGVTKDGNGSLFYGGSVSNTYTGVTTVKQGGLFLAKTGGATAIAGNIVIGDDGLGGDALSLQGSNQIADTSKMEMIGGILFCYGNSETLGTLKLSINGGSIDMGVAATGIVQFADSSLETWTGNLVINDWFGTLGGGGPQQLKFDSSNSSLTAGQLSQIIFQNPNGLPAGNYPATFSTTNPGEVIPFVPEPASLGILGLGALAIVPRRRRR